MKYDKKVEKAAMNGENYTIQEDVIGENQIDSGLSKGPASVPEHAAMYQFEDVDKQFDENSDKAAQDQNQKHSIDSNL